MKTKKPEKPGSSDKDKARKRRKSQCYGDRIPNAKPKTKQNNRKRINETTKKERKVFWLLKRLRETKNQ